MSELKVSPLLDAMELGERFAAREGVECFYIRHPESGREFVLKHISVPASESQVRALLLSGAYSNEEDANAYYAREAQAMVEEAERTKLFLDCPFVLPFLGAQAVKKEDAVGYDVYAVLPRRTSLQEYLSNNAASHLRGINMGIDLCAALAALRQKGYLHCNLKPENIFLSPGGDRFMLGDFGLISTQDLQYGVLPEQYRTGYTAPELRKLLGGLNTTVDIYSLGMVLYRIYNGNHAPFEDEKTPAKAADAMRQEGEPLPAPIYADYELAEIIQTACAYEPKDRYQTPERMRQVLELYMQRNAVSDDLIVPPLVVDPEPLPPEAGREEIEPVHFADAGQMDDTFKKSFSPDTAGAGTEKDLEPQPEKKDKKPKKEKKERRFLRRAKAEAETAPQPEAQPAPPAPEAAPETPETPETAAETAAEAPALAAPAAPAPATPRPALRPAESESKAKDEPPQRLNVRRRDPEKERRKRIRRRRLWIGFVAAMAVLLVLIGLYEFTDLGHGFYHYFVTVESLEVTDVTATGLTLHMSANMDESKFTALCQDAYGNSHESRFEGGAAVFEGLTPGTQYTLKTALEGFHRVSGVTETIATTMPETEILTMAASTGSQEGAVLITLVVKDGNAEPEQWVMTYGPTGGQQTTATFSGHSTQINGLEIGTEYTFHLVGSDTLYLTGQTSTTYIPAEEVTADSLAMDSLDAGVARFSWHCTSALPERWVVVCQDPEGNELEVTLDEPVQADYGWLCTASVGGIVPGNNYLVKVTAPGLFQGLNTEISESLIYFESLTAQVTEEGIQLDWQANREPEAGWLIASSLGEGETLQLADTAKGSSFLLTAVVPNADYVITLRAADGSPVTGSNTVQVHVPQAARFNGMGITGEGTTIGMYDTPDEENWTLDDLGGGNVTPTPQTPITVLVTANGTPQPSDEEINVLFVVRQGAERSDGPIVDIRRTTMVWDEMWTDNLWAAEMPFIPAESGTYNLTILFNNLRVGTINFTVRGG